MPFARVGNLITQTGTDTNLSGLTGSINNNVTTFTAGQKTFYVLPPETRLLVQGTLGIFAVDEAVVTDNDDSVNSGAGDASQAGITIDTTGVLNIEGRIHPTISNASQVLTDVAGASNSLQIAHYFSGSQRPWHGFVTNGPDAGAIGIQTGGTINARGVTLSKGRGGFAPYIGTLGRLQDCIIDTEDRSNPENQGSNSLNGTGRELRGNLSRIRTTQMDIIDCTIIGGSWIIQEQRVEGANLSTFSGLTFATHDKVTTDPGLWLNTSANPQVVDNPSFVGKGTDLSIQSNDVSLSPLYTQNLPTQVYVQNAERGTETIARPVDNNNSSWGYCNFGKHVAVSANVLNGTPADTDQAVFYCEDQPSDFATRNQKTAGTFSTGVFNPATNNASITGQAENAQISYFRRLNNTGNLSNTVSFGTPANTARITIGVLDMPQNENAGNAYDTGNTRIDRRGNAVDNTSTSAEKLQDNFTFYFYREDYQIIETTQSLKGNGIQEFTPIFLPDSFYGSTDYSGSKTTALTTQEIYDYDKFRKGSNATDFTLPSPSGFYVTGTGTTLDFGALNISVGLLPNPTQAVAFSPNSAVIQTGGPSVTATEALNGILTTGEMTLTGIDANTFTSISAGSFAQVPLLTSEALTISATSTGMDTTGPSTQTFNYDGNFRFTGNPPNELGHIANLGTYMVVAFQDIDGVNRENFWTQVQVGDTITVGTTQGRTVEAIGTTFDGTAPNTVPGISFTLSGSLNGFGITGGTGFSVEVQAASINTPGMRPTNSIPTGGDYGATFGEGRWQLTDGQTYEFNNGAFTATDTTLLGPATGTANISLADGQSLMDIAGVATIDNIVATGAQLQPTAFRINFTNQLVDAQYALWRGFTNTGTPLTTGGVTATTQSIGFTSAAITETGFTVDADTVGDYVIGFSSVTGATTYHAFTIVANTSFTTSDQVIIDITPGAQPDQSANIDTTVDITGREVVVEDALIAGRIAFDLHGNPVSNRPSTAQMQRQFAVSRETQNYLTQMRAILFSTVFTGSNNLINTVVSRDVIQFADGGVNGRNGQYILTDTGDTSGTGGSPGVQVAAGFYDTTTDAFIPRATLSDSLGRVEVFDSGSESPHVVAERRGVGVTVAVIDRAVTTINDHTTSATSGDSAGGYTAADRTRDEAIRTNTNLIPGIPGL